MAYRGRILVELNTFLEKKPPEKKLEPISNDDLLVVEVNVRENIAQDGRDWRV